MVPIIIGAAVTASGHSEMFIRSIALILSAVWLSIDVGIWLSKTVLPTHRKSIIFGMCFCLFCCAAMGVMHWFLKSTLEDQQQDAYLNLSARVYLPPSGNVMESTFTIINGGKTSIDRDHQLICGVNLIAFEGNNRWQGGSGRLIQTQPFPIQPGGDSQSDTCLKHTIGGVKARCADITLGVDYVLVTQPADKRNKRFRFIAEEFDGFVWKPQALQMAGSPCARFLEQQSK